MKLIFLGTAAGRPTKSRSLPCIALQYMGEVILFDCGEGSQRQMLSLVSPSRINRIFISHFHGDHYLGLGGLLQTMSLNQRETSLTIYGPQGALTYLSNYFSSGHFGIQFPVHVQEMDSSCIESRHFSIESFPVDHGVPTLGFVFQEKEKRGKFIEEKAKSLGIQGQLFSEIEKKGYVEINSRKITLEEVTTPRRQGKRIVLSSDTLPSDTMVEKAQNCDILIHDSTYITDEDRHGTYHSTVKEACEIAQRARVGKLVLTHISQRYEPEDILREAEKYFTPVVVASDFMEIEV